MKKTYIVSILLVLFLVANVNATKNDLALMRVMKKKKLAIKSILKRDLSKRSSTCEIVTCVNEGGKCSDDDDTLYCMNDMECINGACNMPKEGGNCTNDGTCYDTYDSLYCDKSANICHLRKDGGAECSYGNENECKDNFFCNATYKSVTGVCTPNPSKVGDACDSSTKCPTGTTCSNNICVNYPSTLGAECEQSPGCSGGNLYCDETSSTCKEYPGKGEACYNYKCASGLYCNSDKKCAEYPGEGEPCRNGNCADGFYCNDNDECAALPGLGEKCENFDYECAGNMKCAADKNGEYRCYSHNGKKGDECSGYALCEDGFVCDSDTLKCISAECNINDEGCIKLLRLIFNIFYRHYH